MEWRINITPAPSRRHQEIITDLITQINTFLKGSGCRVYTAPFDVRLPAAQEMPPRLVWSRLFGKHNGTKAALKS